MNWLALASLVIGSLLVPLALVTKILAELYKHNHNMFDLMSERITYSKESDIRGCSVRSSQIVCLAGWKYENNLLTTVLDLSQYAVKAGIRSIMAGEAINYLFVVSVKVIATTALCRMIPQPEKAWDAKDLSKEEKDRDGG